MAIITFNPKKRIVSKEVLRLINKYKNMTDLVVSFGGDGTLLGAEEKYPGVPKIAFRISSICSKCTHRIINDQLFDSICKGKIKPREYSKICLNYGKIQRSVLNEFNIKSEDPRSTIRFKYKIFPTTKFSENIDVLADGLVISTAFGSTGYFKSIARTIFEKGIGIATNNAFEQHNNKVVSENSIIQVRITRGPAILYCDNQKEYLKLNSDDEIEIKTCKSKAYIFD